MLSQSVLLLCPEPVGSNKLQGCRQFASEGRPCPQYRLLSSEGSRTEGSCQPEQQYQFVSVVQNY